MKKSKVLALLAAVTLVGAISAGSTFAYLTSTTGTVNNTFTVGNVNFNEEMNGGLSESEVVRYDKENVPETAVVPEGVKDGQYIDADGSQVWSVTENTYENLVAKETVYKDPTVHMGEDSQDAWVFAKVINTNGDNLTITYASDWVDVTEKYASTHQLQLSVLDYKVYAKNAVIHKEESSTIFTSVTVGDDVTQESELTDIVVRACAVQAYGFESYEDAVSEAVFE